MARAVRTGAEATAQLCGELAPGNVVLDTVVLDTVVLDAGRGPGRNTCRAHVPATTRGFRHVPVSAGTCNSSAAKNRTRGGNVSSTPLTTRAGAHHSEAARTAARKSTGFDVLSVTSDSAHRAWLQPFSRAR